MTKYLTIYRMMGEGRGWYVEPSEGDTVYTAEGPFPTADEARKAVPSVLADMEWSAQGVCVTVDE